MTRSTQLPDPADDPWLPFVIAARAGDEGAERELLFRICPIVLDVVRSSLPAASAEQTRLALDALVTTLKALPTFRGDEAISKAVAQITLECLRRAGHAPRASEVALLSAARVRARRGARSGDGGRITALVDAALTDDAAVLISHIVARGPRRRRAWPYILAAAAALVLAGAAGYWLTRL